MKNLEVKLTQAWQRQSPYLMALAPLSVLYGSVTRLRKWLYERELLNKYHAPVPVWVIGNITVGGSGKTPLIIALVKYLQSKQIAVGVISRGYGRQVDKQDMATPVLVNKDSTPNQVGDEPCLIVSSTGVPMAVGANRGQAIDLLLQHYPETALIISDDGLQHYRLYRDIEWIVVDGQRGFGNGKLLPQGFLREPMSRLEEATVIYHDNDASRYPASVKRMYLVPSTLEPLHATHLHAPALNQTVYAVSGIGYPVRFFKTLEHMGFQVIPKPFADHHHFTVYDFDDLTDYPIITTTKDAVKLKHLNLSLDIWVLPVETVLSPSVYDEVDKMLHQFHIQASP